MRSVLKNFSLKNYIITSLIVVLLSNFAFAQTTYTSNGSGNFRSISWTPSIPLDFDAISADNFIIRDNDAVVLGSNISINDLEIGEGGVGGTFTIGDDATSRSLTVAGDLTVLANSTLTLASNAATHTVSILGDVINAGATFDLSSTINTDVANLTLNRSTTSVISGNTISLNDLTVSGGGALIVTASLTVNGDFIGDGDGTDISSAFDQTFLGNFTLTNSATITATSSTQTFSSASAQSIDFSGGTASFNNITFDNSTKTVDGDLVSDGILEISDDAIWTGASNNHTLAQLEVKNASGITIFNCTITFTGGEIRFGDDTNTDGTITLGTDTNIIIEATSSIERDDQLTIDGDVEITATGQLIINGTDSSLPADQSDSELNVTGTRTLTVRDAGDLYVRGYDNFPTGFSTYVLETTSLIRYDANFDQLIMGENSDDTTIEYGRLYLSQADAAIQRIRTLFTGDDDLIVNGQMNLVNGVSFQIAHTANMTLGEDLYVDSGTTAGDPVFEAPNTTLTLDANQTQLIDGPVAGSGNRYEVGELLITNTSTPIAVRIVNLDATFKVNSSFSVQNPNGSNANNLIVDLDDNQIIGGNGTSETFILGTNCSIYTSSDDTDGFAEDFLDAGDIVNISGTSIIRFDRNGDQAIPNFNGGIFGTLQFAGSGNKFIPFEQVGFSFNGVNMTINGDVTRVSGTPVFRFGSIADTEQRDINHTLLGDWNMAAAYTGSDESDGGSVSPNITFSGSDQIISASNFVDMVFAGPGTKTITGTLFIDGNLTIENGVTLDAGDEAIDIAGNWSENGTAVFTQTGATTDFNSGGTQNINTQSNSYFNFVDITNSTTVNINSIVQINGDLDIEAGSFVDIEGETLRIGRDLWVREGAGITYTDPTTSIIVFDGDTEQDFRNIEAAQNFPTLQFEGVGNKFLVNNTLTIEGDILIASESTFDMGNRQINFEGDNWTNNGNFNSTNDVNFLNDGGTTTVSSSTFHDIEVGISDGSITTTVLLAGNISLDGEMNIFQNGTMDVSASNYSITVEEDWNNYGIFDAQTGNVSFIGNTSDFRTEHPTNNSGTQEDKAFYDLTIGLSSGQFFIVQEEGVVLGDQIDILNDLNINSGDFRLQEDDAGADPGPALLNVGGDFVIDGGAISFRQTGAKIVLNGTTGTHDINLGGDVVRGFEINASGASYQLVNDFEMEDNAAYEFELTAGTLDLNSNILTINRGGLEMTGGTLIIDEGASLLLNDGAADPDFNKTGGTIQLLGVDGSPATLSAVDAGGFTFTQTAGDFQAQYYTVANTTGDGVRIEGGTIDSGLTGNNFANGTFTSGSGTAYLTMANIAIGTLSASNVVFNAGPTNNVAIDLINEPVSGSIEFVISGGSLAGVQDELDNPDGGATDGFIRWNEEAGFTWNGGGADSDWNNSANWTIGGGVTDDGLDGIPEADDIIYIPAGAGTYPIITTTETVARVTIRNGGSFEITTGDFSIDGNLTIFSGATLTMSDASGILNIAGAWSNAGTFNEGTATVTFNGTEGTHAISTLGNGDPFYNLTIDGDGATYTLGSILTVTNAFTLSGGTFDASSGFDLFINNDWTVAGGIYAPGQNSVIFNGTSGTQSISGGTMWDAVFEGAAAKSIDGNISVADDLNIASGSGLVSGNDRTIFVGGNWDLDEPNGFDPGTGTVIFNGTAAQDIEADENEILAFNNVIFQNSGVKNIHFTTNVNGDFSVISESTFVDHEASSLTTVMGTLSQTGGTMRVFDSNLPTAAAYSLTGGLVEFRNNGAQSIPADITFNDLEIRDSGGGSTTATLLGNITLNDDLILDDGAVTLDVAGFTITLADAFLVETDEVLIWNGGTLVHTGANWIMDGQFDTGDRTFENLTLNGTGLKRPQSDIAVNGNLTVGEGVELDQLTRSISNDGGDTFTMQANSILDNRFVGEGLPTGFLNYSLDETSTVIMQATGDQTVLTEGGTITYGDLDLFTVGTATLDGALTVNGDFIMNGNSTLDDANFDMTLNGSIVDIRDYSPSAGRTTTFSRAGDQLIRDNDGTGENLELINVVFGGSGTKTLTPNAADEITDIDGTVVINSGVTVTTARGINFSGSDWTNSGTFNTTVNTRLFIFDGGNSTVDPGINTIAGLTVSNSVGTTVTIQNNGFDLGNGDMTIDADATIDFGNLTHTMASENVNIDAAGSWILTGTTLDFDQNGGQNIPIIDEANSNITGIPSIAFSGAGTKFLTGAIVVDDLTINTNIDFDVVTSSDFQITVNGSWDNNGGDFIPRDGTVIFNSDDTNAKTIDPNGELFTAVTFQGSLVRTYTLQGDMVVNGNTTDIGLTLSSATLDLNGNTLTLGNNDTGDPNAELNVIGNNGTLEVDAGATLQFDTFDDGGDVADTEIGGNLDVQSGGTLSIVGTPIDAAVVTRSNGGNRIDINIESGATISAQYYNFQYLTDEGLEVEDGATIDGTNNFSNGIFSNLETDAGNGTGGDDNPINGNRYLTIESDATLSIENVVFNFDGTPVVGQHYNVTRSNAGGNLVLDFNASSGTLGRSGSLYEDDGDATTPAESNGQLTWDLPSDTQWIGAISTDWNDATNWDNGIPSIALNDVEAIINLGSPFNPTIESPLTVNISTLIINDGILKIVSSGILDIDGDIALGDGTGGALIMDNTTTLTVDGSWATSDNFIFDNGDGNVTFDALAGKSVSISPGDQSFYNVSFTAAGDFNLVTAALDIDGSMVIANSASVIPSTTGYDFTIAGDITATGGTFDTGVDGLIILDGANQTITDMSFDELTASGSGTKTTSGTTLVNDNFEIESGVTVSGGGSITFSNNVTIRGTFNGVTGQTYTFAGTNWFAESSSYTGEGTVEFNRSAGGQYFRQLTDGDNPLEFHNLTLSGTALIQLGLISGGNQDDGNIDLTGDLTINNTINTFDLENYQIDNVSGTGTLTLADNEFIIIRGENNFPSGFATYSLDANSFTRYYGTVDQTIAGNITYGNVYLLNNTTKTLGGNIDIDGDLYFQNATLDVSSNNYSIDIAGRWDTNNGNDDGSFIAQSGTITFDGAVNQTLDIAETGSQSFNDILVNKSGGNVEVATSNMIIAGNLNVFSGTFDANNLDVTVGGNMNASGSGAFASGANGLYYLNASSGTPTISGNGTTINGNFEIDATGRTYELVGDLAMLGSFTLTSGTLDVNGQVLSVGDFEDAVSISGTLNVSTVAKPGGTLRLGNDTQLVVQPGGAISLVGTVSQQATITSTGTTDYFFSVTGESGNTGSIAARHYLIEYVGVDGIYINANTSINVTNNFSDGTFQNGFAGGKYLRIENTQDMTGSNRIENIVFDDNPGGGATNIYKATAASGEIEIFNYSGGFSGDDFDNDPNDLITWLDPPIVTWTGTVSSDWFTVGNWDSGTIPTILQDVVIPQTLNEPVITDNLSVAECNNLTIEINAIVKTNTSDADAVDLQIAGDLIFEASARFESSGTEDNIEIGGSWLRLSNALFTAGTSEVTFNSTSGLETIDSNDPFYNLTINVTGTTSLATDLTIENDFTINTGTFDLSSFDLTVGENFSNSGTINAQSQTISLIPASTSTPKVFDPGSSELYSLIIGEVAGNDVEYDLSNDLTVNHDFNLALGTLDPNTNNLNLGNSDATQDDITVSGTILIEANESMSLGDDAVLLVTNGGDLRFNGTDASNVATLTRRTTGSYDFTVQSGGTLEASFFLMEHMANEGIWLQASSTLVSLSDGTFDNGGSADQYLRLSNSFVSDITANDIAFNTGPTYNVRRNEGAGNNIILLDASGAFSGPNFELDDGSATTGEVQWSYTNTLTVWTGAALDNDWNNIANWDSTIPTSVHTVQIPDVSGGSNSYPILDDASGDGDAASVTIFGGASLTINDNRSLTIVDELANSGTLTISGTGSITVGDSWSNNGTFSPGNSSVILTSDADVTLSGGLSFYDLELDGAGTGAGIVFSSSSVLDVNNDFTITDGTYEITDPAHTLTIGGDFVINNANGSFIDNASTVTFNGANQNIGSVIESTTINFNNLILSGSGIKTLEDDIDIAGDLLVNTGIAFALVDRSISFSGSNFDVDGSVDVTGGTSTVTFDGSQIQIITGNSGSIDLDNFVINNTASGNNDVQLAVDLNINDNVDFATGIVQSSASNPLTFNDGATASFDGSEETAPITFPGTDIDGNSFTVGPVIKIGDDDFIFPIGEGSRIGRIGISDIAGSTATDEYSAQYFFSASSAISDTKNGAIVRVSGLEYWDLSNGNSHSGQPLVTLLWDATSDVSDPATLTVAHYNGVSWDDEGNSMTTGLAASGSITSLNNFTSFSPVTLATTDDDTNPLPVELLSFEAELVDEAVELYWSTASELNNDHFVIERSTNGETFESIGSILGQGTTNDRTDYSYIDQRPYFGKSYYRLTQVDFDGQVNIFDVISISNDLYNQALETSLFPNPTDRSEVTLRLTSGDENSKVSVVIYSLTGKVVYSEIFEAKLGTQEISLALNGIPSGLYHLKVEQADRQKDTKLVIK